MSLKYKRTIHLKEENTGETRRRELALEPLENASFTPETLSIEDIDSAFKEWVENELNMNFEDKDIPTVALFAAQRFTEYMQSWKSVDEKKNFLMNFKVVTRENNPKPGTLYGNGKNIPGEQTFTYQRYLAVDDNGRQVILDYKMKQPYCIDIIYQVSVVTNKLRLLNLANEIINDRFKAITSYLNVNGHYMPMNLGDIGDESDYEIDDRQYYSQTFPITVKGYIINSDSFEVEEKPIVRYSCIENGIDSGNCRGIEIEEEMDDEYGYKTFKIDIDIPKCSSSDSFTADCDMIVDDFDVDNVVGFTIRLNSDETTKYVYNEIEGKEKFDGLKIMEGDHVQVMKVRKANVLARPGKITLMGYEPYNVVTK